jgi:hypothetical protein
MLRYYLHDGPSAMRFKLAGRLAGSEVAELEQCWRTALSSLGSRRFLIDVSEVTDIDAAGRELMELWERTGGLFVAKSDQSRSFVESIVGHELPFVDTGVTAPPSRISLRLAALSLGIATSLLLPATVWADSIPSPDAVLSRHIESVERSGVKVDRETVVIDIEAELPKLAKKGRLEAIRSLAGYGKPEYRVLESEGDRTVRQQVIARYLSADAESRSLPYATIAVTPANYRFRYLGTIGSATTLTYVFQITPKKKRVGLMQGELWIDAATGLAVHQSGRLVKQPSLFLRRVDFIQDTDLREGVPYLRITRLAVETRLVGRADLLIKEHPARPADIAASAAIPSAPSGQ